MRDTYLSSLVCLPGREVDASVKKCKRLQIFAGKHKTRVFQGWRVFFCSMHVSAYKLSGPHYKAYIHLSEGEHEQVECIHTHARRARDFVDPRVDSADTGACAGGGQHSG